MFEQIFVGIIIAVVSVALTRYFMLKSNLVYYAVAEINHKVEKTGTNPEMEIFTYSFVMLNKGSKLTKNVIVEHTIMPTTITVLPKSKTYTIDDKKMTIHFDNIVPHEQITIGYMNVGSRIISTSGIKSDDGVAKLILWDAKERLSKIRIYANLLLYFLGIIFLMLIAKHLIPIIWDFLNEIIKFKNG